MTYAGEDQWIKLALREFPKTNHLILICSAGNRPSNKGTKVNENKNEKIREEIDYFKLGEKLLDNLRKYEKKFPENKKLRYHLLTPPNIRDHHELIRFFRELIAHISKNGEKISINTTSGLQVWKLALYQAALECRQDIKKFYLIKKDTGEIKNIRLYRQLKEFEKNVIYIISEKPNITIGILADSYYKKYGKGNLSFISRTVKNLIIEKLIVEKNVGRKVKLNLTSEGRSLLPSRVYDKDFFQLYNI